MTIFPLYIPSSCKYTEALKHREVTTKVQQDQNFHKVAEEMKSWTAHNKAKHDPGL